ncbi:MAG TPA: arsenosugar biosynthesis radical SAM (seleno)protein ArsS [Vicinamibacterales bacterium]|nr:arsenosugar biosynthesis radical SAM (seleno)protein ArsS [Vicinamibacterales bacterium]
MNVALPTLLNTHDPLADPAAQRAALDALPLASGFGEALARADRSPLRADGVSVLQMNVGKRCNQTCRHCHVDAGPDRTEVMPPDIVDGCLRFLETSGIPTLDITGGAPELHPSFRDIVRRARAMGRHVMDRCNLTITRLPSYQDLPEFLAAHQVEVIASLPSFAARQTDAQRGSGVFDDSIAALRRFNELGYGIEGSGLVLNLVTNPVGAFLPGGQRSLEADWKRELHRKFGLVFNRLYTITNMPISRFLQYLIDSGNLQGYMDKLVASFNPAAVDGLMCRSTLSVGWDGRLYDCDFNQMIELGTAPDVPQSIVNASLDALASRRIVIGHHCFGCTAGAGSSCGGAIT